MTAAPLHIAETYNALSEEEGARPAGGALPDSDIRAIEDALHAQDSDTVTAALQALASEDVADLLSKIAPEDRRDILTYYAPCLPAAAFADMDPELSKAVLSAMPAGQVAAILTDLDSDDALTLLVPLDEELRSRVVRKLSATLRATLEEGLAFPEDSAGRLMQRDFVAVPEFWTAGKTIDYIRAAADTLPDNFFDIFVISPTYEVLGEIPLSRLIRAKRSERIENLSLKEIHPIPVTADQEEVAHIFRRKDLVSAPVVDGGGRLVGVITVDDVVDVIHEEADEDILRLGGVEGQGDLYRAVLATTGVRFRWLFINLGTALLASWVIGFFDGTLERAVALAILMPVVASMGGNAGMQAVTVAVRALAKQEISGANRWRIIWKETLVGLSNGILFAAIAGAVAGWWFSDPWIGVAIAGAMVVTLAAAGLAGAGIPIALARLGSDPAVSSTVVLTTITDIVGFAAFLGLAAVVLF
jgi:magnesium transporter